jgi:hypothetical protein
MNWWNMDFEQKIILIAFVLALLNFLNAIG